MIHGRRIGSRVGWIFWMAVMMALWARWEKAALTSMDSMALSWFRSRRVWVSLWMCSEPEGTPMANRPLK